MNIAFAGFKHNHIIVVYKEAALSSDINIVGAWEKEEKYRNAAREEGVKFTYETYEELLADETVDIVAIGDQYGDRGSLVIRALQAGKHVFTDKPLCTSLDALDEIESLVRKTGKKVRCMYSLRFWSRALTVKSFIESGKLGKVNNIYFGGQHPLLYGVRPAWYFEAGKHGGVINDIAIHGVDLVRFVCGLETEEILAARCWNAFAEKEPAFLDSAQFMLRLSGGAGLLADVSYAAPDSQGYSTPLYWTFDIWGTKGVLRFSDQCEAVAYLNGETEGIPLADTPLPHSELADFLAEIRGEKEVLLDTKNVLISARKTLQIQAFADARA